MRSLIELYRDCFQRGIIYLPEELSEEAEARIVKEYEDASPDDHPAFRIPRFTEEGRLYRRVFDDESYLLISKDRRSIRTDRNGTLDIVGKVLREIGKEI